MLPGISRLFHFFSEQKRKRNEERRTQREAYERQRAHIALRQLRKDAEAGDPRYQALLGQALLGRALYRDEFTSLEEYDYSGEQDNPYFSNPVFFEFHPELHAVEEGVDWIRRAAEQGLYDAIVVFGQLHIEGIGVLKDPKEGERLILQARQKALKEKQTRIQDEFRKNAEQAITEPTYLYPEELKYETKRGEYVRSKAEQLIANLLYEAGITYHYERPWHGRPSVPI